MRTQHCSEDMHEGCTMSLACSCDCHAGAREAEAEDVGLADIEPIRGTRLDDAPFPTEVIDETHVMARAITASLVPAREVAGMVSIGSTTKSTPCPDCGELFATPQGLGAHRRHKKCPVLYPPAAARFDPGPEPDLELPEPADEIDVPVRRRDPEDPFDVPNGPGVFSLGMAADALVDEDIPLPTVRQRVEPAVFDQGPPYTFPELGTPEPAPDGRIDLDELLEDDAAIDPLRAFPALVSITIQCDASGAIEALERVRDLLR